MVPDHQMGADSNKIFDTRVLSTICAAALACTPCVPANIPWMFYFHLCPAASHPTWLPSQPHKCVLLLAPGATSWCQAAGLAQAYPKGHQDGPRCLPLVCGFVDDTSNLQRGSDWQWAMHGMAEAIFYEQGDAVSCQCVGLNCSVFPRNVSMCRAAWQPAKCNPGALHWQHFAARLLPAGKAVMCCMV